MGSSQTRAWTHVPCIGRRILDHCATREALDFIFKCMSWPRKAKEHRLPVVSDSPFLIFWSYRKEPESGLSRSLLILSRQYTIWGFKIHEGFYSTNLSQLNVFQWKAAYIFFPRKLLGALKYWLFSKDNDLKKWIHRISILKVFFLFLVLSTELSQNIKLSAIQHIVLNKYLSTTYFVQGPIPVNTMDCKNV